MPQAKPLTGTVPSYDLAVFIGRFQPFHNGHLAALHAGLQHATHVCVLIGSAHLARSHRNPFTFDERAEMVRLSLAPEMQDRVIIRALEDSPYNEQHWVWTAQTAVIEAIADTEALARKQDANDDDPLSPALRIALIGHGKDHTSYYLDLFPGWDSIAVPNHRDLSATDLRVPYFSSVGEMWLNNCGGEKPGSNEREHLVPPAVHGFLSQFRHTQPYRDLVGEYEFIQKYRTQWADSPYPPIFVTTDCCVVQSGHVLLIRRKARPGKGLWAMPGGFLKHDEYILAGTLRELYEETRIRLHENILRGSIVATRVFDNPHRSARGRTITHASLIHLKPARRLPEVKGRDDAMEARWWPLAELQSDMFFEDHGAIVNHLTALL